MGSYQPAVLGNGEIAPHTDMHFVPGPATRLHPDEVHSAGLREDGPHSFEKRQLRVHQVGRNRRPLAGTHVLLPAWEGPGLAEADGQVHHRNVAFTDTTKPSSLEPPNAQRIGAPLTQNPPPKIRVPIRTPQNASLNPVNLNLAYDGTHRNPKSSQRRRNS
jgi:hypothetical protein